MSESVEAMVKKILKDMNTKDSSSNHSNSNKGIANGDSSKFKNATANDYPILQKHPEWVKTPTGKTYDEITLEGVLDGSVTPQDVRITSDMLYAQGAIATDAGRPAIKNNLDRAAELVAVPDDVILSTYSALRPYRSSKQELLDLADRYENEYDAKIVADFIREAAELYEQRKKLKGDN
jgi:propanediol dehydratase small subunit